MLDYMFYIKLLTFFFFPQNIFILFYFLNDVKHHHPDYIAEAGRKEREGKEP